MTLPRVGVMSTAALREHFGLELPHKTELERAEDGFFAHMAAEPDDDMVRLVYADWLDEHGRGPEAAAYRVMVRDCRRPYGGDLWSSWTAAGTGDMADHSELPWRWRFSDVVRHVHRYDNRDGMVSWGYGEGGVSERAAGLRRAYETAALLYPGNDDPPYLFTNAAERAAAWRESRGFDNKTMPSIQEIRSANTRRPVPLSCIGLPFPPRINLIAAPPLPATKTDYVDFCTEAKTYLGYFLNTGRGATLWWLNLDTGVTFLG